MVEQRSIMQAKKNLVEEITEILKADLDFLFKLAPRELGILATSLRDLKDQKKDD